MTFGILRCGLVAFLAVVPAAVLVGKTAATTATKSPATPAYRIYGSWRSSKIGGGGYVQRMVFFPSDPKRNYVWTDVGGIYRSDDGGLVWHMLSWHLPPGPGAYSPRGLLVAPTNANRLVLAAGMPWGNLTGIYISADGGKTWRRTAPAVFNGNGNHRMDGNVLVASPLNSKLLLAGSSGGGIWRSTNGGNTWQVEKPQHVHPVSMLMSHSNANRAWMSVLPTGRERQSGVFTSTDGGRTWTKIFSRGVNWLTQDPVEAKTLWGLIHGRVVQSQDGGTHWVHCDRGLAPFPKDLARADGYYGALAAGPNFMLVGGHGGHFYRYDYANRRWEHIPIKGINERHWWGRTRPGHYRHFGSALASLTIDPHNPRHWAFTDWYALYQSYDAGLHWNLTIHGIEMGVVHVVAQDIANPKVVHLGMADDGYFRSTNAARSFRQIARVIPDNVKDIATTPANPQCLYATGPREWQWLANQAYRSTDDGLNWQRCGVAGLPNMNNQRCNSVAIDPANAHTVYLGVSGPVGPGHGGVYKSTNSGQTWHWMGRGLAGNVRNFFGRSIWSAGPEIAISTHQAMVAISINHGLVYRYARQVGRWTACRPGVGHPNGVIADDRHPGRFYVAMRQGGLYRTNDGGKKWQRILAGSIWSVAVDAANSQRLAAIAPEKIWVSLDGGKTWKDEGRDLPYPSLRDVAAFAGNKIVVGTPGCGAFWRRVH